MRKIITNPDGSRTRISSSGRKFHYPKYGGGGSTVSTVDKRQLNPITNQPLKETQKKSHTGIDSNLVEQLVKGSVERGINPNTTLAIGLQETGLGTFGSIADKVNPIWANPLRYQGGQPSSNKTNPNQYREEYIDLSLDALKDKYALAKRLNKTSDADSIQAWNGYGKVYSYDNRGQYGIPYNELPTLKKPDYDFDGTDLIPNGKYTDTKGIDMNTNPVYGKTITNLRDSVILQSPQIQNIVSKYYNPKANPQTDDLLINRAHRNIPYQSGGKTQAELSKELDAKPQPKRIDSEVWDEVRQEYVPSWKFATPPKSDTVAYKDEDYYDSNGNKVTTLNQAVKSNNATISTRPKQTLINFSAQNPSQIFQSTPNLTSKGQTINPPRLNIKPEVKRQYKEENGKYYMRFFNKLKDTEQWRPVTKRTFELGDKEQEDTGIRYGYGEGGNTKPYKQPSAEASKSFMDSWSGVTTTKDIKPTVTQAKADVPHKDINKEPLYYKPWSNMSGIAKGDMTQVATGKTEPMQGLDDPILGAITLAPLAKTLSSLAFRKSRQLGQDLLSSKLGKNIIQTPSGFQNRVFESNVQLGSFKGKGHLSQKGFNYRTLGEGELKAIQDTKGVFPKVGKAKGGNSNVKYWTKGNEKNWYADNPAQQVIRVPETNFDVNKVVDINNVEFFNHKLGKFQPMKSYKQPYKNAGRIKRTYC